MGYTHYWYRPKELDAKRFELWRRDVFKLSARLPERSASAGGYYADKPVRVEITDTADLVEFNGAPYEELGHELFFMPRVLGPDDARQQDENGLYFQFCKTARKPYDLLVVAALVALHAYFPEITIASDGDGDEWADGLRFCQRILDYSALPQGIETTDAA